MSYYGLEWLLVDGSFYRYKQNSVNCRGFFNKHSVEVGTLRVDSGGYHFFYKNILMESYPSAYLVEGEKQRAGFTERFYNELVRRIEFAIANENIEEEVSIKIITKTKNLNDCSICLNKCSKKNSYKLDCQCVYNCHKSCLNKWLEVNNNCIICKK